MDEMGATGVHAAMDNSWMFFGRVVIRPPLLDLDRALDSMVLLPEESVLVQGFLIGRPAPEQDALVLVRTMRDRMAALVRQATLLSRDSAAVRRNYVSRARTARRVATTKSMP